MIALVIVLAGCNSERDNVLTGSWSDAQQHYELVATSGKATLLRPCATATFGALELDRAHQFSATAALNAPPVYGGETITIAGRVSHDTVYATIGGVADTLVSPGAAPQQGFCPG